MLDLGDPKWQGISVIVAVAIFVLPAAVRWFRRGVKGIVYQQTVVRLQGSYPLANQITNTDWPHDLDLVLVRLTNTGKTVITVQDFIQPVSVKVFGGRVIATGVTETIPAALKAEVKIGPDNHEVALTPLFLNPRDSLVIWILSRGVGHVSVQGRFIGVQKLQQSGEKLKV